MSTIAVDYDKIEKEIIPSLKIRLDELNRSIYEYEHNPELMEGEGGRRRYYQLLSERYDTQKKIAYFEKLLASCRRNVSDVTENMNDIHIDDLPTPGFTVQ